MVLEPIVGIAGDDIVHIHCSIHVYKTFHALLFTNIVDPMICVWEEQ